MENINYQELRNDYNTNYAEYFKMDDYTVVWQLLNIYDIGNKDALTFIDEWRQITYRSDIYLGDCDPNNDFEKQYLLEVSKSAKIIIKALLSVVNDPDNFDYFLDKISSAYQLRYIDDKVLYQALRYANANVDLDVRNQLLDGLFPIIDIDYLKNYKAGKEKLVNAKEIV